ncbi:MAG: SRPBCC family protein [Actinomycetota bacterium]
MDALTSSGKATVATPTDTQILIAREFDAPKHLIYRAYTEPELIKQWWSGKRGEVTSAEVDLRVGGRWRYVMTANEGFEVAFHGTYREIVPNERLVSTELYEGVPDVTEDDATVNTTTFVEVGGRTTLTTLVECHTKEIRDLIIGSGMEGGMQEAMDRLEQVSISLA